MNKEQMYKYAYECMVKNNPEEAVKNLLLKDKIIDKIKEELEYINESEINGQNLYTFLIHVSKIVEGKI